MTHHAEKQPFWITHGLPAPGTRLPQAAYLALPETTIRMELIDGVVVYPHWNEQTMSPSPTLDHQNTVGSVYAWLRAFSKQHSGTAHVAPLDVVLADGVTVQPDVMWRASDSACTLVDRRLHGPPELVIEVLSPGTARHDRTDKFDLYETRGIGEYWIVDPRDDLIEVYTRADDRFQRVGAFKWEQKFASPMLGQAVPVSDLLDV
jgi:Uma2 family endonuclease